jgi:phage/plasmid-like protein (TIGR03299 family)
MSHAIEENDLLAIGYTESQGRAWHNHENAIHYDGPIPLEFAQEIMNYTVDKTPIFLPNGQKVQGQYLLVCDKGVVLSPSTVTDRYEVIQNNQFVKMVNASILSQFEVEIETCGTLFNRARAFINTVVMEHTVKGDCSPTRTRLLFTNGFDNTSYTACVNQIRVVCNNTLRAASAQGKANATLRKFKHTASALQKIEDYAVDLAGVVGAIEIHNENLDHLAEQEMTVTEVEHTLHSLFGITTEKIDKGGKGATMAMNKNNAVLNLFENKDDLQGGIARTRYALLNAVTDWADHDSPVRGGSDAGSRMWDGVYGTTDTLKQNALTLLNA